MKIFFLSRGLNYGGAERQLVILANELARRRHDVVIATYYSGGALAKELSERVRLIELGKRSRWHLLSFYFRLLRIVRREQPDVLHAWGMITPNLITTLVHFFYRRARLFWCVPSSNLDGFFEAVEWTASWFEGRLSRFADCIVSNSESGVRDAISRGFPAAKMLCIPNGIDVATFYPDPAEGKRVRDEWGIQESERVVGLIARIDPIKNHPLFLKVAARLSATHPDVRFVCVGHGPKEYEAELRAMTRTLGLEQKLLWVPARSDMRGVFNALDVFCSSSYSEGFPNVIGEAMACGRRGVVTDVGDCRMVVGNTASVVPSNDVAALAAALEHELEAQNTMNLAGRLRIVDNFTVTHLGDKTEQALFLQCAVGHAFDRNAAAKRGAAAEARPSRDPS